MVERSSTPPKEPQVKKKAKAEKLSQDRKDRRELGKNIVSAMSGFIDVFRDNQKDIAKITKANLKETQQSLLEVFSQPMQDRDLIANIEDFKAYLEDSGESVEQFGKKAKMSKDNIKALSDTIRDYDKSVRELNERERALKKAGLVVEQKVVDGKHQLVVLNGSEIRDKQRQIINNRKRIEELERDITREAKRRDEEGKLSQERQQKIEEFTQEIEELNTGIQEIKDKGVKEVKTVLSGFAGDISDFYTRQKNTITEFTDAFLPGPVATVFNSLVQAVDGLVKQVLDLFKPITATIGAIIKAPRFIAKKFFGKTDEEVDMMFKPLKDFGKKVGTFLLKPFKVVGKYMKDMFLRPFKLVALAFKKLGGVMKKLLIGFGLFNMKTLLIVGLLALLGLAVYLFGNKLKEIGEFIFNKMKEIFIKVKNTIQPVVDALVKGFNFLLDAVKSLYNFLFKKKTDEDREDRKVTAVEEDDAKEVKKQSKKQLQNLIKEKAKEKGIRLNTRNMKGDALVKKAQQLGVDSEMIARYQRDQAFIKSQEAEDKFLKESKVKFENEFGRPVEMTMSKILDPKNRRSAVLQERLKDNKQFLEFQKKKAEFDAEQARIMSGQGNVSNVATNVQQTQVAGVTTKAPTRNTYAPYTDMNAMSYGQ